jgi:dolichol-phosphate mannosyltransferase
MHPEISIVVPLFNEEANVAPLVDEILSALRDEARPMESILVDDASTDDTWLRVQEACRSNPRVRGLQHARNSGQSASLWTGIQASRGSIIATLDGDRQNDPADLPQMLAALDRCDLVCGMRLERCDNALRRLSSRIARVARKAILGVDFRDSGCNLRVFKRPVLETLIYFNGFHRFVPILAHGGGAQVREIPVHHRPRIAGRSKYGIWNRLGRGCADLLAVAWFQKRRLSKIQTVAFPSESRPPSSPP